MFKHKYVYLYIMHNKYIMVIHPPKDSGDHPNMKYTCCINIKKQYIYIIYTYILTHTYIYIHIYTHSPMDSSHLRIPAVHCEPTQVLQGNLWNIVLGPNFLCQLSH